MVQLHGDASLASPRMRNYCKIYHPSGNIRPAGLVVGGFFCPQSGQIASGDIPYNHRYVITMFGGGSDAQNVACGGQRADGSWYYIADSQRFGCGTHVRITNPITGASCVAASVDYGPNVCIEQAAGMPVIDASPLVLQHLFGVNSSGWEDGRVVTAEPVDATVPLGIDGGSTDNSSTAIGLILATLGAVGAWYAWETYQNKQVIRKSARRR